MAKKNIAALMNGLMGASKEEHSGESTSTPTDLPSGMAETEDREKMLTKKRYQNVGRPPKGEVRSKNDEIRATFIVSPEIVRKLKFISLVESSLLKDVINTALTGYIDQWENENGTIKLPRKEK